MPVALNLKSALPLKLHFVASHVEEAQEALSLLTQRYSQVNENDADVIIALGGDGLMLQTMHRFMNSGKPIYGMNRGSVGFLMNEYRDDLLIERLQAATRTVIHPLIMKAVDVQGVTHRAHAINEVSMLRQSYQAAKLEIAIDGKVRMDELVSDGILLATPAGSTAYNLSAHGPIVPIGSPLLALTPISPFRPRRWRGALIPNSSHVVINTLEASKRPVSAVADHFEVRHVVSVDIREDASMSAVMLFDANHNLEERMLTEQFF